jgi:choice-of-anchor C domain-containing protein
MHRIVRLLVFASLFAAATPTFADPILVNGSFEMGPVVGGHDVDVAAGSVDITGWIVTGDGPSAIDYLGPAWDVSDGVHAVDLDGRNSLFSGIQQTFSTVAGFVYQVSFDLSGNPGDSPGNGLPLVKQARVMVDGFSQDYSFDSSGQALDALVWQAMTFSFVASGSSATLAFTSLTPTPNSYGALIDNVSVTAVPEPPAAALLGCGVFAIVLRRWRVSV